MTNQMKTERKRVSAYLPTEIKTWYYELAQNLGISESQLTSQILIKEYQRASKKLRMAHEA